MILLKILFCVVCMVISLPDSSSLTNNNSLLLILSFDGFRWDYMNRNLSNTMMRLKVNSSYAPYMISVFPTKTFTNHFSVATGLYSETHGVLDNVVFDRSLNETLKYGYELFHYNENVVPLWILNERAGGGRHSGCMMWPGSNFDYQGTMPLFCKKYNNSIPFKNRVDTLISWFNHPVTPINLGMMYFEQPDADCHKFGPDSKEVNEKIALVDWALQYLLKKVKRTGLHNKLNIVIVSDHGAQTVKAPENVINLNNFVDRSLYFKSGYPPTLQIYPTKGKESEVLKELRAARHKKGGNFSTFTHEEMLDRWHYKHCNRTPPILITADVGYIFKSYNYSENGTHGYDPQVPNMRAIFMATGPLFKKNYTVKPFENINIYPLAAHILGLDLPDVRPNGSLAQLQEILVTKPWVVDNMKNTTTLLCDEQESTSRVS